MKKTMLLSIALSFFSVLHAQYNLQFNQVITLNGIACPANTIINIDTVPANKVWKLENWTNSNDISLYFNNTLFNNHYLALYSNSTGTQAQLSSNLNPIWLKAGDIISVSTQWNNCQVRPYFFSIIEFNLTP